MNILNEAQTDVIREYKSKNLENGVIFNLYTGFGKTLLSYALCFESKKNLIICSKSLISVWKKEFDKFFKGKEDNFAIYETSNKNTFDDFSKKIIITTHNTLLREDKDSQIFKIHFNNVFLDEFHRYVNCTTKIHQIIDSINKNKIFLLSGTPLQEVNSNNIKGIYNLLKIDVYKEEYDKREKITKKINKLVECPFFIFYCKKLNKNFKYTIKKDVHPDDAKYLEKTLLKIDKLKEKYNDKKINLKRYFITREKKEEVKKYEVKYESVFFDLKQEKVLYDFFKDLLLKEKNTSNLFFLISIIRRTLIIPFLPFANYISNKILSIQDDKELKVFSEDILKMIEEGGIKEWLTDSLQKKIIPTRIQSVLDIIKKHPNEGIVIFSCFVECLNYLKMFIKNREIFSFTSNISLEKREEVINSYLNSTNNPIFLTTYNIGSEGLNLQTKANVIIKLDMYWNCGKEHQAECRVDRKGQLNENVYIYSLHSNTAFEKNLIELRDYKEDVKNNILEGGLKDVRVRSEKFSIENILKII